MLACKNISYYKSQRALIKSISLSFCEGKIHGIIGPNGSGKSTLLKCLAGIWRCTEGQITWKGKNLNELQRCDISKIITYVPQQQTIRFNYTVAQFIKLGRYIHHQKTKENNSLIFDWVIDATDLVHLQQRSLNEISAGERQRAYIARALATEAEIILLDEPTASLDIRHQIEIWDLLEKLNKQGRTVIVANHDFLATEKKCAHIALLHQGHCIANGSFHEIMTQQQLHKAFGVTSSGEGTQRHYVLAAK